MEELEPDYDNLKRLAVLRESLYLEESDLLEEIRKKPKKQPEAIQLKIPFIWK